MGLFAFILVLFITILLSFFPEQLLKPKPAKPSLFNFMLQSLIVALLFLVLTLVVQRPVFSGIAVLVFLVIMVIVSNAKYQALREPMVFSDITMFSQAFKHPRLYFPFLGLVPVIFGPLIIVALIYTVLKLEPAMPFTWQRISGTLFASAMLFILIKKLTLKPRLSLIPEQDNAHYGLLNSLFNYAFQANTQQHRLAAKNTLETSPFYINQANRASNEQDPTILPNITVVQSESFFDARRLHPGIRQSLLTHFDSCKKEALMQGKLKIPAWGANTMRSEFSFLTGIPCSSMDLYQFYPYQYLSEMPLYTLASSLRESGYYCVCIHPHPASFFGRNRIFPKMGFDEFIDIEQFDKNDTFGPYISDQAVTQKIIETTKIKTDKPLFIFAITMENHGPLHLEKITPEELPDYYDDKDLQESAKGKIEGLSDLTVYLRHLKNADKMINTLTQAYNTRGKEALLCFYGDHVPSMPEVYTRTQYSDDSSDYFIWSSTRKKTGKNIDLEIESLATHLINH